MSKDINSFRQGFGWALGIVIGTGIGLIITMAVISSLFGS